LTDVDHIAALMQSSLRTARVGSEVAINTHCLYPSNGVVTVYVMSGPKSCTVSDRGATARVVEAHGVALENVNRWLTGVAKRSGLVVSSSNELRSPQVPLSALPVAVMQVANAAARAALEAVEDYSFSRARDLAVEIEEKLAFEFGRANVARNVELTGESNRIYHFDFQAAGAGGVRVIVDHVVPHASSINAKAVAHIDLSRKQDRRITQAMIYDPKLDWNSADIIFLRSAAPTVPIERMGDAIRGKSVH
jgi:hypothetical protein